MIFRQLCTPKGGHLSYLLGDPITRQSVIIDPLPANIEALEDVISGCGLTLQYILQTSHDPVNVAASIILKKSRNARIVAHENVIDENIDLRLRHGDTIYFGEERLRVLHTPGVSACAVTYWWEDRLFTGKTLLAIGTDPRIRQSDPQMLYRSITQQLLSFPGETIIYPSLERKGRRLTSIEELRRKDSWFNNQGGKSTFLRCCSPLTPDKSSIDTIHKSVVTKIGAQEEDVHHYMPGWDTPAFFVGGN